MVCPECGNDEFKQRRIHEIDAYVKMDDGGELWDTGVTELQDSDGQDNDFNCTDCNATYSDFRDLVTEEEYNREDDCDLCDGHGQIHHGEGALGFVTLCPNACGSKGWDADCEAQHA